MKVHSMCIARALVAKVLLKHCPRPCEHAKFKVGPHHRRRSAGTDWGRLPTGHHHCVRAATTLAGTDGVPEFKPKRAVVLTKITRYEYERRRHNKLTESEFKHLLESKHSNYQGLLQRHHSHLTLVQGIRKTLIAAGIETRVVQRFDFDAEAIDWADVVFTAGGDGTYLLAATKFLNKDKPLIGINTDPEKSEGHLLLPKRQYPASNFKAALQRMLAGDFRWRMLQRIGVSLCGCDGGSPAVELHDQQLQFPEQRYTEHIAEHEQERQPVSPQHHAHPPRPLPVLALNEVFVGESLSSRVSYYEFSVDEGPVEKQKSSGVTICTGTGSSSWHFHINHLPVESVQDILRIANRKTGSGFAVDDWRTMELITQEFNSSLRFDPQTPRMAYTIRDPVVNGVFQVSNRRNFASKIRIRSRMWDGCLVIDGGMSFKFNDGAVATFEIAEGNAIRTLHFD